MSQNPGPTPTPQQTAGTAPKPQIRVTQIKDWASI